MYIIGKIIIISLEANKFIQQKFRLKDIVLEEIDIRDAIEKTPETLQDALVRTQNHGVNIGSQGIKNERELLDEIRKNLEEIKSITLQDAHGNVVLHIIYAKIMEMLYLLGKEGDLDVNKIKPLFMDIFKYADEELRAELEKDEYVNQILQYLNVYNTIKFAEKNELRERIHRLAIIIHEYYIRKSKLESKASTRKTS